MTAAAKKRLPNLDRAQLHKIVVDKWTKMTDREKQVYRAKSVAYAKIMNSSPVVAARPTVSAAPVSMSAAAGLSTVLSPRAGLPASIGGGSAGLIVSGGGAPKLPLGWRRTLVQRRDASTSGGTRYEVCLHTPTGVRLRTKAELAEYTKRYKLTDITEDVLSFKRPVSAQLVTKRLNTGVIQRTGPTVFRPGMVEVGMAEVGISAGSANSDGPRTVKLVVRNPSGPPVQPAAADSERKSARWDEMKISVSVLYWNL